MIYFLMPTDGGPVKIGHTDDMERRHKQLETYYGRPLVLLATLPGDIEEEQAIHGRFSHLRLGRTEQFRPEPELMEFIGRPLFVNQGEVELMDGVSGVVAITLTDTPEYREWLAQISRDSLIPIASIVRDALARWAKDRGYPPPPKRKG